MTPLTKMETVESLSTINHFKLVDFRITPVRNRYFNTYPLHTKSQGPHFHITKYQLFHVLPEKTKENEILYL